MCIRDSFMGAVLVPFDISLAFVSCFLLMLPWVLYAFKMKETVPLAPKDKREKLQIGKLFTNYYFMTYVVLTFAINIYLGITLVFYPYILAHANVNSDYLGLVIGFRALVEMGSMSLTGKLRKVIPLPYLVAVSALLFGVENLIYSGAGSLAALLCGVVMSGLASGIAFSQGPAYVQDIVPNELKSTAQVFNAMTMSIVSIAGTFFGGRIIDQYGIAAFNGGLSVIIFCIFLFFVLSLFLGKKVFHFELHSNQREQENVSRSAVSE